MSGIGYFKPATVDRLRRLTADHFTGAQSFKRDVIETCGERLKRRHVTSRDKLCMTKMPSGTTGGQVS